MGKSRLAGQTGLATALSEPDQPWLRESDLAIISARDEISGTATPAGSHQHHKGLFAGVAFVAIVKHESSSKDPSALPEKTLWFYFKGEHLIENNPSCLKLG